MVHFVAHETNCSAKTSGSSIITGADPELTNELLQQLAVLVYRHYLLNTKNKQSITAHAMTGNSSRELLDDFNKNSLVLESKEKRVVTSSFVKRLNISFLGRNGESVAWDGDNSQLVLDLHNQDDVFEIRFNQPVRAQSLIITPIEWINTEFPDIPALRVEVVGNNEVINAQNRLTPILDDKVLIDAVKDIEDVLSNMISLVSKVNSFEQSEKSRRQEEMKKVSKNK
jgi:hypothetical protein